MKKSYVWDTGVLSLYFADHIEVKKIMSSIQKQEVRGYVPQIVYGEFYYKTWQKFGKQTARVQSVNLRESKLEEYILSELDTYVVGETKLRYPKISMFDGIIVATAKATKSIILSTDEDFESVDGIKSKKIKY